LLLSSYAIIIIFVFVCFLMRVFSSVVAVLAATLLRAVAVVAVDPTDEFRDADPEQSSYLTSHNMDPAIVNSPQFGQLWKIGFNSGEQVELLSLLRLSCPLDSAFFRYVESI
jgi:hypothetical protein